MLQIFLVERIPAYEFSADLVTRLCCPTTLRFFRQNVNAGSKVAPLGAEENLLAEFRKGSSLPSCSGLWGSREETSAARYIPFRKLSCACLQLVVLNKIVLCQKRQELGKDVAFFTPQLPFDGEYLFYETLCQTFFLSLVVPLTLVSGDGEPFDIELYPPGLEAAHQLLSKEELQHMFGVDQPHMVDHTRWK